MSMYCELLRIADAGQARALASATDQDLQALLAVRRRRLDVLATEPASRGGRGVDAAMSIAIQIDYDLVLLGLCRSRGISCDAGRFNPLALERLRLERALAANSSRPSSSAAGGGGRPAEAVRGR
jgi:hypothetical protein